MHCDLSRAPDSWLAPVQALAYYSNAPPPIDEPRGARLREEPGWRLAQNLQLLCPAPAGGETYCNTRRDSERPELSLTVRTQTPPSWLRVQKLLTELLKFIRGTSNQFLMAFNTIWLVWHILLTQRHTLLKCCFFLCVCVCLNFEYSTGYRHKGVELCLTCL